ncbi:MAG TPA: class I SAM-dependent methyltransferase [Methanosarcina thermophila]|nr:class I SAM-dependent methyltransferase [Methanosarcina thermophila]
MDTSEIYEEEINVEEIMEKIQNDIRSRKKSAAGKTTDRDYFPSIPETLDSDSIHRKLEYIKSSWNIENNSYFITSHRPISGKFLIKGRELVHGEVRRYVDPTIRKQNEFNESLAHLLESLINRIISLDEKVAQLSAELDNEIYSENSKLKSEISREFKSEILNVKSDVYEKINREITSIVSSINLDIENKAWLNRLLTEKIENNNRFADKKAATSESEGLSLNHFLFEEKFRGSRDDIKQRQSQFLEYFRGCSNVLDIGCGRGEFLELLNGEGIGVKGIDIDDDMVGYCLSRGFDVQKVDAVSYLEQLPDKSLDGIFIDQVVEHLDPAYLVKLLRLCYQKLNYGYYLFAETVNPLSLYSFANFYIDLTHIKPVHPETLKFLFESSGFRDVKTEFISPVTDELRLKKIQTSDDMNEREKAAVEVYNHNIDLLNYRLYGPQDYAVIGKK